MLRDLTALLFLPTLTFSGCSTLSTHNVDSSSGEIKGIPYYLPIGKITIKGNFTAPEKDKDGKITTPETLTMTLTPEVEADEGSGIFYATPRANYFYDDEVHVTTNGKHLLNTGNVTSEDKTVAIVAEVTSLVSDVTKARQAASSQNRLPFDFSFRPSNAAEYNVVKARLADRGIELEAGMSSSGKEMAVGQGRAKSLGLEGLLFRPATSYNVHLTVKAKNPDGGREVVVVDKKQQFILPDPSRLYEMKYPRIAFVKRVKNIGFTDGMLTDFHQTTPSPVLGFFGIPKAIIKAAVPIPGG